MFNKRVQASLLTLTLIGTSLSGEFIWAESVNDRQPVPIVQEQGTYSETTTGQALNIVYTNDFEDDDDAKIIGDNKAREFDVKADIASDWTIVLEPELSATYDEKLNAGTTLEFDIILPEDATYNGSLKGQAVIKLGDSWAWTQSNHNPEVKVDDFITLGNGYKKVTLSIKFAEEIEAEQGLKSIIPRVATSNCDYEGKMYIDNVKLIAGEKQEEQILKVVYENKFENDDKAVDVAGVKALEFDIKADVASDWAIVVEPELSAAYDEKLNAGTTLEFDIILPEDATYAGSLKGQAVVKLGDSWTWTQSNHNPEVKADGFTSLGNGYKKVTLSIKFAEEVEAEQGLKVIIPRIAASNCDYQGKMYLTNVRLLVPTEAAPEEPLPEVDPIVFSFDTLDSIKGWSKEGGWEYSGDISIGHDAEKTGGALAVDLDYSADAGKSWSEAKIKCTLDKAFNLTGYTQLKMDFIYNPAMMSKGSFQLKVFSDSGLNSYTPVKNIKDYGNGLKKGTVTLNIGGKTDLQEFTLGLIGTNTDYKGTIYLDNITFGQAGSENDEYYVNATIPIEVQTPISVSGNSITANGITQSTLSEVKLADESATANTAKLYAYLEAVGKTDSVLFGHQNDIHHKVGSKSLSKSDTEDVTGSISAVVGIDTLSLTGNELGDAKDPQSTRVAECAAMTKEAAAKGAIITLSAHMPNFQVIQDRIDDGNGYLEDGSIDFSGYTPGETSGDIVQRIMPGQDLNGVYTKYLDMIAEYAHALGDTPVLFRPFHENTGSWFWWGAAYCDSEAYKNLYSYTVDYLRDEKGVHNFIYVYSPSSEAETQADYEKRYPGDDYVDMIGFDMYHDNPRATDSFINNLKNQIQLVDSFAKDHNKLFAVTETGIRNGSEDALLLTGNTRKDWYNEILEAVAPSNASYFLLWANFGENDGYYTPFVVSKTDDVVRGHEMLDYFIDFYNDSRSVFANEMGDYTSLNVNVKDVATPTGFISNPISGSRILEATTITATVRNVLPGDQVSFKVYDKEGNVKVTYIATAKSGSVFEAKISNEDLKTIGETLGSIKLFVNDKLCNTINAKFNMPEATVDSKVVDNFETYYGDSDEMSGKWASAKGVGCGIKTTLDKKRYEGNYGLSFNYSLIADGYAGITKNLGGVDWSDANALQFWTIPDGKSQKVVIQITSGGKVFEAYLQEFEDYNKLANEPVLVTIPFSKFLPRDNKTDEFKPSSIDSFGLFCNAIVPTGVSSDKFELNSTIYYDNIRAINSNKTQVTFEKSIDLSNSGSTDGGSSNGGSSGGGSSNSSGSTTVVTQKPIQIEDNKFELKTVTEDVAKALQQATKKSGNAAILDNQFIFVVDSKEETNSSVTKVTFDLKDVKVEGPLTLVKYEKQEDGTYKITKLGGNYNKEASSFIAYMTGKGEYALIQDGNLRKLQLSINDQRIYFNDKTITSDVIPYIKDGVTMVPIRIIAEQLGAEVKWNSKTKEVYITRGDKKLVLSTHQGDVEIKDARTYVKLRYVSEEFGADVLWIPNNKTIYVVE